MLVGTVPKQFWWCQTFGKDCSGDHRTYFPDELPFQLPFQLHFWFTIRKILWVYVTDYFRHTISIDSFIRNGHAKAFLVQQNAAEESRQRKALNGKERQHDGTADMQIEGRQAYKSNGCYGKAWWWGNSKNNAVECRENCGSTAIHHNVHKKMKSRCSSTALDCVSTTWVNSSELPY